MPGTDRSTQSSVRRIGGLVLSAVGAAVIAWATLRPSASGHVFHATSCCSLFDIVVNILLFIPLGAGLVLLGLGARLAVATGALVSAGIELTQYWWIAGRFASATDVAANLAGTALGLALILRWDSRARWWPVVARVVAPVVIVIWVLGAGWVGPAIPGDVTWVVDRPLAKGEGVSRGPLVVCASLQGILLSPGPVADVPRLRSDLATSDRTRFEVTLLSGRTAADSVRLLEVVVGGGFDPYLVLSQERDRLVVYYRLRMTRLGIRGPALPLEHGTSLTFGDTVRVSLLAKSNALSLQSVRGSTVRDSRLRLSPDLFLSALFYRVTDGVLWWRLLPSMVSFLALGLALAGRPLALLLSAGVALFLGPWLSGAAVPAWPVLLLAMVGAVGGRKLARDFSLFPVPLPVPDPQLRTREDS